MNAAIYARVSKKRKERSDDDAKSKSKPESESESVETQVDGARAFIAKQAKQGWTLDESHIYKDDGVSGALFASREEFQRMMADAEAGAFGAIVFFDLDRFGRDAQQSMAALSALAGFDVEVYDYSTGIAVDIESFEGETMTFMKTRFAQQYRDQIRKHTRRALRRKAELGHATGNKIFGYDNKPVPDGGKGHVELHINESEAAVIRDIYARSAAGDGARTIAAALNRKGVPKPRAQEGRADGWSVSTIRAVLRRPLYRGEVVYGRTSKAYGKELRKVFRNTKREKGQIPIRDEATWTRCVLPEVERRLRIIDPELAARVDARLDDRRERYLASRLRNDGRAPEKAHGKYLLSGGMLLCPTCGGHFEARKNPWRVRESGGHPDHVYICATRRRKPGVCPNTLALNIDATDDAVLSIIEGEVLGTRFIRDLLAMVEHAPDQTAWLTEERDRVQTEVDNLVKSLAAGVPAETVAPAINERQAAIRKLDARLRIPSVTRLDHERLKAALEQRAKEWKRELRAEPRIARLVVRRLVGPIVLFDESKRPAFVKWEAQPTVGLLDGLAAPNWMASPAGFEPAVSTLKGSRAGPLHHGDGWLVGGPPGDRTRDTLIKSQVLYH